MQAAASYCAKMQTVFGWEDNNQGASKLDKSWEPCNRQGITFLPIAVESLGAWHPQAVKEVKKLASAKARHTGEEESLEVNRLFQKLSVALMRGNAALFNNRVPFQGASDDT